MLVYPRREALNQTNQTNNMTTYTTIKKAAETNPNLRVWGLAQKAYGRSKITFREFGAIVKILSKAGQFTVSK